MGVLRRGGAKAVDEDIGVNEPHEQGRLTLRGQMLPHPSLVIFYFDGFDGLLEVAKSRREPAFGRADGEADAAAGVRGAMGGEALADGILDKAGEGDAVLGGGGFGVAQELVGKTEGGLHGGRIGK